MHQPLLLETPQLLLRAIAPSDNEALFAYRSNPDANPYQGWVPKTLEEVDAFIAKNPTEFNTPETWFQLVIAEKEHGTVVGDIGIHFMDSDNRQCEIGCTLHPLHQGKGWATEAMRAVVSHLFSSLNKHRVVASIDPRNTASLALVERLGFRKEGQFKKSLWFKNEWVDDVVYALLSEEWTLTQGTVDQS